ncbi:MAG: HDIG domain-containing protein [Rhabdochlamydiaceae bacterium]|nr:HDIG domain-containing protein [Candidatus Amphrikana amoebophyrae]
MIEQLKSSQFWKKFALGFSLLVALFCFLHFKEVRIESLEIGAQSQNYIVAQVDFEFPDREATLILKQEAVRDIGHILMIDEGEIKKKRFEFENFLIHHRDWRTRIKKTTFEEVYNAADVVEEYLLEARLTDPRTFQRMKESDISVSHYQVVQNITAEKSITLPNTFWQHLEYLIVKKYDFNPNVVSYILGYFKQDKWKLEQDHNAQRIFRHAVEASIPERYTKMKSGRNIIGRKDMVTERHVAMLKAMKRAIGENRNIWQWRTICGSLLFSFIIVMLGWMYVKHNHKEIYRSFSKLILYVTIIVLTLIITKSLEYVLIQSGNHWMEMIRYPLVVPFTAILICILLNKHLAIFTTLFITILLGTTLAVDHGRFIFLNTIGGLAIILFSKSLRKRKEIFSATMRAWLSVVPALIAFKLYENQFFDIPIVTDLISTFSFMVVIAILVIAILPALESIFHVMTDITLMEYVDPNNELLRRLSLEAPGTYQHSLVVGSLSEAAAHAIGANGLFCRVASMYHDIGKLFNPHYFTENQMGAFDIHQLLTPLESTQVIIAHVSEGVTLAKKYSLPKSFIEIILEHHGTTLVYYFYCKQVELMKGNVDSVDESQFCYPGPKPRSKESAIIMIADTIEAASRSLDDPSEKTIGELVDRLVDDKAEEGQFDECQLTFEELGIVKKKIVKTLSITRHLRIKYPERKK